MDKLVMVYNADGGWENAIMDSLHKIFSPSTYPCKLCAVTFGLRKMEKTWEDWLNKQPMEKVFLHKDEWPSSGYDQSITLPAILLDAGSSAKVLVSAAEWNDIPDAATLIRVLEMKLTQGA